MEGSTKDKKEQIAILSYNGANEEVSRKRFWSVLSGTYSRDFCTSRRRNRMLLPRNEPEDGSSCYDGDAVLMCHMPRFPRGFTPQVDEGIRSDHRQDV
uniref:Uncharacterized protein n=1 Tax=Ascaris lumbricoides TaxID=6252 RepID=A0A0M3IGP4_ASCLU